VDAAAAWAAAIHRLGGRADIAAASGAELERRWAEPHRRYHSSAHLAAVLRDASWLAEQLGLDEEDRALVVLAACAHDVVYDGHPGDDERASAEWARQRLTECGLRAPAIERVVDLVLATSSHAADPADTAAIVLLDADLAILGADEDAYAHYADAVREEYAAVPEDEFRRGRARILTELLDRDPLYLSAPARTRWAAQARRNLSAELERRLSR
jgi:predicted metal-dependent HD superfamily phosphohydrolase